MRRYQHAKWNKHYSGYAARLAHLTDLRLYTAHRRVNAMRDESHSDKDDVARLRKIMWQVNIAARLGESQ
jgi:hypothetical protein